MASFLYKFFIAINPDASTAVKSAGESYVRAVSSGTQAFKTELSDDHPGKTPQPKYEAREQASGEVLYTDDLPASRPAYAAFVMSTGSAPALVTNIDASAALAMAGVIDFVGAADIPGFNCASPFGPGEEVLFPAVYAPSEGATDAEKEALKAKSKILFAGQV